MDIIDLTIKISSLLTAIGIIITTINKIITKLFKKINNKIYQLEKNQCENFLVNFLAELEKGKVSDCQSKRAHEIYDHYINDLNGNSFIKERWEELNELKHIN